MESIAFLLNLYSDFAMKNYLRKYEYMIKLDIPYACGLLRKNIAESPDCLHLDQ